MQGRRLPGGSRPQWRGALNPDGRLVGTSQDAGTLGGQRRPAVVGPNAETVLTAAPAHLHRHHPGAGTRPPRIAPDVSGE